MKRAAARLIKAYRIKVYRIKVYRIKVYLDFGETVAGWFRT